MWGLVLIKLQAERESSAGDFLWVFGNFKEHLFNRIPPVADSEACRLVKRFAIRHFRETLPI